MLQRIQTIFLLFVLVFSIAFYIFPTGTVLLNDDIELSVRLWGFNYLDSSKESVVMPGWYMVVLNAVITLTTLVTIILFRHRSLQVRFSIFNIIVQLGFFAMLFVYLYLCRETAGGISYHTNLMIVFPIAQVILTILAIRSILIDNALVKSVDRLR